MEREAGETRERQDVHAKQEQGERQQEQAREGQRTTTASLHYTLGTLHQEQQSQGNKSIDTTSLSHHVSPCSRAPRARRAV